MLLKQNPWVAIGLVYFTLLSQVAAMDHTEALRITHAWAQEIGATAKLSSKEAGRNGAFEAEAGGAVFRYKPDSQELLVSGLVADGMKMFTVSPEEWDVLVRASNREQPTLAEGRLDRVQSQLLRWKPDVILLTKGFKERPSSDRQFFTEVRWLLEWATYWRTRRYGEVVRSADEDELIREAVEINEWMRKNRSRPW